MPNGPKRDCKRADFNVKSAAISKSDYTYTFQLTAHRIECKLFALTILSYSESIYITQALEFYCTIFEGKATAQVQLIIVCHVSFWYVCLLSLKTFQT